MEKLRPRRTLEIGLCFGGSALLFTAGHRHLGRSSARQHTALDPFQSTLWDDAGLVAVERAGLAGYLDFRLQKSSIELPRLLAENTRFDLIYVDGSHLVEDVFVDAYYAARLLSPGGVIVFDDSTNPHVRKVLRFLDTTIAGLGRVDLSPYRQDAGGLCYRIAARLGRVQMTAYKRTGDVERAWDAPFRSF